MGKRPSSRYGKSIFIPNDDVGMSKPLQRIRLNAGAGERQYSEAWLQDLLFRCPEVMPVGEIEPAFSPTVPLCKELPTAAGPIDLAFISEQGLLTLVECKLWRNPDARRDAISQILDYAKEVGSWSYEDLNNAVRRATGNSGNAVFDLVDTSDSGVDEEIFIDDVTRSLARGQFLLLIVGDGIRESVERITEYLKRYSGLHFTFGLVELAMFEMPEGHSDGLIVEPRVIARTVEIERGVVRLADRGLKFEESDTAAKDGGHRSGITEEIFYEELERLNAGLSGRLKSFFSKCEQLGLSITVSKASLILNWYRSDGARFNFGSFFPDGTLRTNYIVHMCMEAGDELIGVEYLEKLASFVPNASVRKEGKYWTWRVDVDGRIPPMALFLNHAEEWISAISDAIRKLDDLLDA